MLALNTAPVDRPPSLREAQRALTRDRILAGARALFAEKPYVEATIDEIALRSGVARATFYLHFEGKDALVRDLLIEDMAAHRRLYHRLTRLGPDPDLPSLCDWLRRYMRVFSDRRASVSLFNVVIGYNPDFLSVITRERDALFDDVGQASPAFRFPTDGDGPARRLKAHLLTFRIEQFCVHAEFADWSPEICDLGVEELARELSTFIRRGEGRP
jgi:AcrR family transcriptional regulator